MKKALTLLLLYVFFNISLFQTAKAEYEINSTLDLPDDDLDDNEWKPRTLRAAIQNINKNGVGAKINCALIEYQTIYLSSSLPALTPKVIFDGKGIVLEPAANSTATYGLWFVGNGSEIRNIKIKNFKGTGLVWQVSDGVIETLVSCFNNGPGINMNRAHRNIIGGDTIGYYDLLLYGNKGNSGNGLAAIDCNDNIIQNCWAGLDSLGNPVPNERYGFNFDDSERNIFRHNVVSGNAYGGINVDNDNIPSFTVIENNKIGTDYLGNIAIPNQNYGIVINQSHSDTIRNNLISGNNGNGIYVGFSTSSNILIENNKIGTNRLVTDTLPNSVGIRLNGFGHIVRNNIVSGNRGVGISLTGNDIILQSNIIGLDSKQQNALPNGLGIQASNYGGKLVIGDTTGNNGNVIAGNLSHGIHVIGAAVKNVIVSRNYIGANRDTSLIFPNGGSGIILTHSLRDITIKENLISANKVHGVRIERNVVIFLDTTKPKLYQKPTNIFVRNNCIGCAGKNTKLGKHGGSGVSVLNADSIFIEKNVIIGADAHGIDIANDSTKYIRIWKNRIGPQNANIDEQLIGENGINVSGAEDVLIGSQTNEADSNIIMNSKGFGLMVIDSAMKVYYLMNKMSDNRMGGIALDSLKEYFDKGKYNDVKDVDIGSNDIQNTFYLELADAKDDKAIIKGILNGKPNESFRIEMYLAKKLHDSIDYRTQGTIYLGWFTVKTSDKGIVNIDTSFKSKLIETYSSQYSRVTLTVSGIFGTSPFSIISNPDLFVDVDVRIDTSESYADKNGNVRIKALISNLGNKAATTVSIRDTIPNLNVLEYSISKGIINKYDSTIIATIPNLDKGESVFYECYGYYKSTGNRIRSVKAYPSENDRNLSNNVDSILIKIEQINILSPIPKYPLRKQKNINNPLRLVWYKLKNAIKYHLQVSKEPFTSVTNKNNDKINNQSYLVNDSNLTDTTYILNNLSENQIYFWRVAGIYGDNSKHWCDELVFLNSPLSNVESNSTFPSSLAVYPNPAMEYVDIYADISSIPKNWIGGFVDIKIFNQIGECVFVERISISDLNAHKGVSDLFRIDVSGFAKGVYLVRLNDWIGRFVKL
jgi:parallel beta-helix repeat protein